MSPADAVTEAAAETVKFQPWIKWDQDRLKFAPESEERIEYAVITSRKEFPVALMTSSPSNETFDSTIGGGEWTGNLIVTTVIMVTIMTSAVIGNLLVVTSVLCYDRLRRVANSFIVSLAFADLLVAVLVMPFNASQIIAGRWVFDRLTCDMFNADDVLFSTASLIHLCCISMDRYMAVTDPFNYEQRMTRRRAILTLIGVWTASACLSHIPIHLGLYTTETQRDKLAADSNICSFKVNSVYGIISSTVSFWTPAFVMIFTYVKIYREARKQEQQIAALARSLPPPSSLQPVPPSSPRLPSKHSRLGSSTSDLLSASSTNGLDMRRPTMAATAGELRPPGSSDHLGVALGGRRVSEFDGQRQKLSNERRMMRREHKAAKTLGVIMGAFLVCWLPFFTWYLTDSLCSDACSGVLPEWGVDVLFWIGYANSALNPVIYPCFNRDFREAFRRLLSCHGRCSLRCCKNSGDAYGSYTEGGGGVVTSLDSYSIQMAPPNRAILVVQSVRTRLATCLRVATGARYRSNVSETTRLKGSASQTDLKSQKKPPPPTTAIPMIILND